MRRHLLRRPRENPFARFGAQLAAELPRLLDGGLEEYHAYAFATVRMVGAAFEIAATHSEWLFGAAAGTAAAPMHEIVGSCKTLGFRLARRRAFDVEAAVAPMAEAWERAIEALMSAAG